MIKGFNGKYECLCNAYPAKVYYGGICYDNAEAAFQAQKCNSDEEKKAFAHLSPSEAKMMGRMINLRPGWNDSKDQVMYEILMKKFKYNVGMREVLLSTGTQHICYANHHGDQIWGICGKQGENRLGKALMKVRDMLRIWMIEIDTAARTMYACGFRTDLIEKRLYDKYGNFARVDIERALMYCRLYDMLTEKEVETLYGIRIADYNDMCDVVDKILICVEKPLTVAMAHGLHNNIQEALYDLVTNKVNLYELCGETVSAIMKLFNTNLSEWFEDLYLGQTTIELCTKAEMLGIDESEKKNEDDDNIEDEEYSDEDIDEIEDLSKHF